MQSKAVLVRRQQEAAKRDRGETAARNSSVIDFNDHLNPEYQLQKVNEFWHGVRHKSVRNLKYTSYDENDDNDDDDSDVDRAKNFATSPNKSSSGRLSAFASLRSFSRRSSLSFSFLNDKPSDEVSSIIFPHVQYFR